MFKKFILFFILLIIFLSLSAFFVNVFNLQKNYFSSKDNNSSTVFVETEDNTEVVAPSSYSIYTKELFENALSKNRVIVLFFNANWCKECIDQSGINTKLFEKLTVNGIVGLESHTLDSESTTETDALAKKFDVAKENTYVILDRNGAVAFRHVGLISEDVLTTKILEVGEIK